ncbi:MAG: hypothetical protein LBG31_04090 [Prevotellaceae bacterium]|jgi:hypothetical protein|nr:hypothetical protein [Prevotellaceae bacterium]
MKKQKKPSEIYRNALAVYLNLATDNVDTWLKKLLPDVPDAIQRLKGENNVEQQMRIFNSATSHFFFLQWMYNRRNYFAKPNDETTIAGNYKKLTTWIGLLYDLRNYWSHTDHEAILLEGNLLKEINELLLELYLQACAESKTKIPDHYKSTEGINLVIKNKTDDVYTIEKVTQEMSFTGIVFYACLFLDGRQINDFLESMEQSNYSFDELNARMEHRKKHPYMRYPDNLTSKTKHFLYARDVYKYWQLRGHRATITVDASLEAKEQCFGILEYLKRCPKEALELSGWNEEENKTVVIDNREYGVREKDKFFDWALAYWDEEMERLGIAGWQWARHQTTEEIQEAKNILEQKAKEAGRPYHFPRYQKVVFDIPQNPEERTNYRNDEHGFTYFLLKDDNSDKATQAMFRYKRRDDKTVIGLMNGRLLCSVLEWYFYTFPVNQKTGNRNEFWMKFFHACFKHIENTQRAAKPKANVSKEQVKKRIDFLREKYSAEADQTHQKLQFILDTWNQIISYGRTTNMEHAGNHKDRLGAKNGYQELLRYLSLMSNNMEDTRKLAHGSLVRILEQLGMSKSKESYFTAINKAFSQCKITNSPFPLRKMETIEEYLNLCRQYRETMLKKFEERLAAAFNADDWRPAYEMRWLGLSDARTQQAAQHTSPAAGKTPLQTNIVNVDNGSYPAVGLPRDVRHLREEGWQNYLQTLNKGNVEKIHLQIYPSPNNCTLLIPAFYENATYEKSVKYFGSIRDHKRLYLIRRQDTVISHIAYKKWQSATGQTPQGLTLQDMDYQSQAFDLPVSGIFIRFYYRYFKQNRYQLPPKLTEKISALLKNRGIVREGAAIDFNSMKLRDKSILTHEEQLQKLLSKKELEELPADQQEALRKERFERMNPLIFYPSPEKGKFYFDEILQGYLICRRAIMDKIHQLEEKYKVRRKEGECYTDFNTYAHSLAEKGYIDKKKGEPDKLIAIRNAAFHGDIPPEEYIPQELVKNVKNNPGKLYFDYFGEGMALIEKLPSFPKQNNAKRVIQNKHKRF